MKIQITWLGHAAFLFDFAGVRVVTDPYLRGNPAAKVNAADLPADLILVTHGHNDHVGDTVEIAGKSGASVISNTEICSWLDERGVKKTLPLYISGARKTAFGSVKAVSAVHGSSLPDGSYGGLALGFLLSAEDGRRIYFAGDTGLFGDMKLIGDEGIDVAILPIGGVYTMGAADSIRAIQLIRPKVVIPMHFNTWELIRQDASAWEREVSAKTSARPVVLPVGGVLEL